MEVSFTLTNKIDPVAVYAAIVATLVFVWQVYVWLRRGPRFRAFTSPNMKTFGLGTTEDTKYVVLNVSNVGDASTTITHFGIYGFSNFCTFLRRKRTRTAIVKHAVAAYSIPYVLYPGHQFMSMIEQDRQLTEWSRRLRLYAVVLHTTSSRPVMARIRPLN